MDDLHGRLTRDGQACLAQASLRGAKLARIGRDRCMFAIAMLDELPVTRDDLAFPHDGTSAIGRNVSGNAQQIRQHRRQQPAQGDVAALG